MQWQPIETAPEGKEVLVTDGVRCCVAQMHLFPDRTHQWWGLGSAVTGWDLGFEGDFKPRAWMPLPELPEFAPQFAPGSGVTTLL